MRIKRKAGKMLQLSPWAVPLNEKPLLIMQTDGSSFDEAPVRFSLESTGGDRLQFGKFMSDEATEFAEIVKFASPKAA